MKKIQVTEGCAYVDIPEAGLRVLCGCPENAIKFLMKAGIVQSWMENGFFCETGPNAILLSELCVQNGSFRNLGEFPVLQMLYRQGMLVPGHPGNTGAKPILFGLREQLEDQASYIFHGNYGLSSLEQIMEAGIPEEKARELFRMKLRFSFGSIRQTRDLLDLRAIDSDVMALGGDVFLHRNGINRYSFIRGGESVEVDLNVDKSAKKNAPYELKRIRAEPAEFTVIHIGEGDGWDPNNPCMGSIICWKGEYYLVDAGPNIGETLSALGIVPSEIRGIFQTHCHDDHFVGLTDLLRIDRKIEFYATPLVRKSILRKLCGLTSLSEMSFKDLFDFHDLVEGNWNDVAGLEVMPCCSPHPVETDIFFFRTLLGKEYRTYAHLADIASFSVLDTMVQDDTSKPGLSRHAVEEIKKTYLTPVDVKKIDAGGGMIHGNAEDFRKDSSGKIFIAHTAIPVTERLAEIVTRAEFGMCSHLLPTVRDYRREHSIRYLARHLPGLEEEDLGRLASCAPITLTEGRVLLKNGDIFHSVYLIVSGQIAVTNCDTGTICNLDAGSLVGEYKCLTDAVASYTYTADCPVEAIEIPRMLYSDIVQGNGLFDRITRLHEVRLTLRSSDLFREELGGTSMDELADAAEKKEFSSGEILSGEGLFIITGGKARISMGDDTIEIIGKGGLAGEERVLFPSNGLMKAHALGTTQALFIPVAVLGAKPILRWILHEYHERRLTIINNTFPCTWREEFSVGNKKLDIQHSRLYSLVEAIRQNSRTADLSEGLHSAIAELISFAREHFASEEGIMADHGYPQLVQHSKRHAILLANLEELGTRCAEGKTGTCREVPDLAKSLVLRHTLLVDRQYMPWLAD